MRFISATLFLEEMASIGAFVPPLCRLRLQHRCNLHTVTFRCDHLCGIYARSGGLITTSRSLPTFGYFRERTGKFVLDEHRLTF